MKTIDVRRCSTSDSIIAHTQRFIEALRTDQGIEVRVSDGLPNEFRVFLDGGEVSVRTAESLLPPETLAAMICGGELYVERYPA